MHLQRIGAAFIRTALCSAFFASSAYANETPPPMTDKLDSVLASAVSEGRISGAVLLVAKDGNVIYHRAVGHQDCEGRIPMQENALFRHSSVTKVFTSMAAAVLINEGMLDLDEPIAKLLPEFAPALADGTKTPITVRQLMSHTAGLDYGFFQEKDGPYAKAGVSDGLDDQPGLTLLENLRRLATVPLLFEPGTGWNYSLATDVLGEVVARANKTSLEDAVRNLVTAPLKLKDSGFLVEDRARIAEACRPAQPRPVRIAENEEVFFGPGFIRFSPKRIFDKTAFPSGGAGMAGTAPDFLRLLEVVRTGGAPLIEANLTKEMNRDQTGGKTMFPGTGFGLGWSIILDPALAETPQSPGTLAWGGVYGHAWFIDPAEKLTVTLMTNTALEGMMGQTAIEVRNAIYEGLPK